MNNNMLKFVVREGDTEVTTRLMCTLEVQNKVIDELISKTNKMEVDVKVQSLLMAQELTCLQDRCARLEHRVLRENLPNDRINNVISRGVPSENESVTTKDPENEGSEMFGDKCNGLAQGSAIAALGDAPSELPLNDDKDNTVSPVEISKDVVDHPVSLTAGPPVEIVAESLERSGNGVPPVNESAENPAVIDSVKHFKNGPICALQELCMARKWELPSYTFFEEGDSKVFTCSVECTVLSFTVRVEGMFKKDAKRQAASLMYYKVENVASPPKNDLAKKVAKNNGINWLLGDVCAGLFDGPALAAIGHEPELTLGDCKKESKKARKRKKATTVNQVSTHATPEEVSDHTVFLAEHDSSLPVETNDFPNRDESHVPPAFDPEDDRWSFSTENSDLANRLRLSKKPSMRQLKELNSKSKITFFACVELFYNIVSEEGLTIEFDMAPATFTQPIRSDVITVILLVNAGALTVVGRGKTVCGGQLDAAHKCVTLIKSILDEKV